MADNLADTETAIATRTEAGQFLKGVSGNPKGRPKKVTIRNLTQDLEIAIREHLSVDRVKRIVNRMADMAEQGHVPAAKLILDKLIANAKDGESDEGDNVTRVVFQIENATFAAKSVEKEKGHDVAVIDVTPVSVKETELPPTHVVSKD